MDDQQTFQFKSYSMHEKHMQNESEKAGNPLSRLENKSSIDFWRHLQMYELTHPFLSDGEKWLTVGDGIGTDANWLSGEGVNVIASDISDSVLKLAYAKGFIPAFSKVNAENIGFDDNSFDYILCKEAYHHFPKPYSAIYEMIRVAKKGVILIEPQDPLLKMPFLMFLKNTLDRINPELTNKLWKNQYSFETVGNYVYKLSEREIEKIAMGLGLPAIAFKGVNDYYDGSPKLEEQIPNKVYFAKVKRKIAFKNLLSKLGLIPYQLQCFVILKNTPNDITLHNLKKHDYRYFKLPGNPYA